MTMGPVVWMSAVLSVLAAAAACAATYVVCRRALAREVAAMRRLLKEQLAAVESAEKNMVTPHAEAAPRQAANGVVRVRIRKRTPGFVLAEDAAVIAAAALSAQPGEAEIRAAAVNDAGSNWAQQGRALLHAARNVYHRPSRRLALSVVRGNGEGRSEAAD